MENSEEQFLKQESSPRSKFRQQLWNHHILRHRNAVKQCLRKPLATAERRRDPRTELDTFTRITKFIVRECGGRQASTICAPLGKGYHGIFAALAIEGSIPAIKGAMKLDDHTAMRIAAAAVTQRTGQTTKANTEFPKFQKHINNESMNQFSMKYASFTTRGPPRWRNGNQWPPHGFQQASKSMDPEKHEQPSPQVTIRRHLNICWTDKVKRFRQAWRLEVSQELSDQTMIFADTDTHHHSMANQEASATPKLINNKDDQYNMATSVDDQLIISNPRSACPRSNGPAGTALGAPSAVATGMGGISIGGGGGGDDGGRCEEEIPAGCDNFGVPVGVDPVEARFFMPFLPCVGQLKKAGGGGQGVGGFSGEEEPAMRVDSHEDTLVEDRLFSRVSPILNDEHRGISNNITYQMFCSLRQEGFFDREEVEAKPPENIIVLRTPF